MQKSITSFQSLKRLLGGLELEFVSDLLAVVWRVVAAVRCFFRPGDYARAYRPVRATLGATGTRTGAADLGRDKFRAAARFDIEGELRMRLEHLLLSHLARVDDGSPMPPMTLEALIVPRADDADARIVAALEAMQGEPNSDWTHKRNPAGQKWFRRNATSAEKAE